MARFFDSLRDPTAAEETLNEQYRVGQDPQLDFDNLPTISSQDPQEISRLKRAGFVPGAEEGTFQTPSRDPATRMAQKEYQRQLARQNLYDEQKNSTLFKIGDTLADTGRLFMSPLFWLSGEDTTKYDPSATLKSGYRQQLQNSEAYTAALYNKVQSSRSARLAYAEQLRKSDATIAKQRYDMEQPISPAQKAIQDFAFSNGYQAMYNSKDPTQMAQLNSMFQVQQGTAFPVGTGGRVLQKPIYEAFTKIQTSWSKTNESIGEVFNNFRQLKTSLAQMTGAGDVAAIFTFMKTLDPDSVVRESEFEVAANAAGTFERLKNIQKKHEEGTVLSSKAREEILMLATELVKDYETSYEQGRENKVNEIKYLQGTDEDVNVFLGTKKQLYPDVPFEFEAT